MSANEGKDDLTGNMPLSTAEDVEMQDAAQTKKRKKSTSKSKGHEITSKTIKYPAWSYLRLELFTSPPTKPVLDDLTVRTYLTSAFTQYLGLMGASISVDLLKVEGRECWIRVPREDLSAVVSAAGAWIGGSEEKGGVGWKVRASGNWLGSLVGRVGLEEVWSG